jgi:hypothetical protein
MFTSNIASNIKHFLTDKCIRVSLRPHFHHFSVGHDARAGWRRRNEDLADLDREFPPPKSKKSLPML